MAVAGTINSDLVAAGQGTQSVPPGTIHATYGSVTIPAGTSFATTDSLVLCAAPGPNSSIVGFFLDLPALTGTVTLSMSDGTNAIVTVTSTVAAAGGIVGLASANHGKVGVGVQYTTPTTISLVPVTGTTSTVGASAVTIYFAVDFVNY